MRPFWLTCLLLSSVTYSVTLPTAFAASDPENFVVKISSYKDHKQVHYEGSGMLVQYQKSVYVLTSEHVVLHDNDEGTHLEFKLEGKESHKMTYISSDWGMGLAILKAPDEPASDDFPKLEEMAKTLSPQVGEQAISVGFPLRSRSLLADVDGSVSSTTNKSMVLADIEQMLELKGAHGEFGMSGGAVLNHELEPIGVLSHESSDPKNKTIYAIPISQAAQWAIRFITDANAKPRLVRTSFDFLWPYSERVRTGRLIIEYFDSSLYQSYYFAPGEKHPERVWISWDDNRQDRGLNPPTEPYPGSLFDRSTRRISPYLENGRDTRAGAQVIVSMFCPRDFGARSNMVWISSLVDFFRKLKDPQLEARAIFNAGSNWWEGCPLGYCEGIPEYCKASQLIHDDIDVGMGDKLRLTLENISEFSKCVALDSHGTKFKLKHPIELLSADDIERALNHPEFQADWANLNATRPSIYNEVRNALETIKATLAGVSL